ncbi:MAG: hypothetical protein MJZ16_01550 [Bacteroidales bacterium]|nr:hypothetical protein [Bacteroidales bacterium]
MIRFIKTAILALVVSFSIGSCIEPPLHLPGDEVLIDYPVVLTDINVVWDVDADLETDWYYGWDDTDKRRWGEIGYPMPTNYEVRRYYLGTQPNRPHTEVDGFTIYEPHFHRFFNFGYYDMLLWSNIDSDDGAQVVLIDESDMDEVRATTTGTKGMTQLATLFGGSTKAVAGIFNQPEIFYSAYKRDIYISRNFSDYDYFDEKNEVWVKKIDAVLNPLVYIYLVQIVIYDNDGRIIGVNGNNAVSGFASSTSVNTGHTGNNSGFVYYESRMKKNLQVKGRTADVIGGKLTTYGLCDMEPWVENKGSQYEGSRSTLSNIVYFDLTFSNGKVLTMSADVTEQCQRQAHGGIITIELNATDLKLPDNDDGVGSLFVPTVEDYDEVIWNFEM